MGRVHLRLLVAVGAILGVTITGCSAGAGTVGTSQSVGPSQSQQPGPTEPVAPTAGGTAGSSPSGSQGAPDGTDTPSGPTGTPATSLPPPSDKSISLGLILEPTSLDFTTDNGAQAPQLLLDNVYETLVTQAPDGSIVPGLAESWTVSDDGLTYDFRLHEGVTFSDGTPFTADDAAFTIDYVKTKWTVSVADAMDVVSSATAVSPTELRVVLSRPSNLWLFKMTTRIGAMMSPDHVDTLGTDPIGTGPYVFTDWQHGESITLTRNPHYWGTPPPLKTVVFRYFKDPTAMNNAMLTGQIQVITTVQTPQALSQFDDADRFRIIEGSTNGKVMMGINNAKPPLDDLRVRRAINYALDKPALLQAAWGGHGTVIGSHEVPTDPWFVDLADRYPHDVAKAKDLLAEAGQSDLHLTLTIASGLPYAVAAAPIIVSQLGQAGITVDTKTVAWDVWLDKVYAQHDYDLTIVNHVEQYDVTTVFDGTPDYYTQYTNPEVAKLEADGDAATDHATFIADFQQVMKDLADDAAAAWLWAFPNLMVTDTNVHGLPKNAIGESLNVFTLYTD